MVRLIPLTVLAAFLLTSTIVSCRDTAPQSGAVLDEARRANREIASFPHASEDHFRDMDGAIALTPEEVRGRNMWNVWTGGNDRFWNTMTHETFGYFDLRKIVSSHPTQLFGRGNRWEWLGVVNEPCFERPSGPDPARFGLWLDRRGADCAPDSFEDERRYPGVSVGARGKTVPVGSFYGQATGILGLRLFPNPDFDDAAQRRWDPERYYTDPAYYLDRNLVRPYRVGMSCGFCHIGPDPTRPPTDPENPRLENLSSIVGAQYMWVDRLFFPDARPDNFMFQLVHTYRPGSMDTSLVSTDNINNPRTMNAFYRAGARLEVARRWGRETLTGDELRNRQFNEFVREGPLTRFFEPPNTVWTPHILKDGSDSVGVLGALNRVYLNIGLFSEEWLLHFNAVAGGRPISPIKIEAAQRNSSYWQATEAGTPDMARFLIQAGAPHRLRDAPGGERYLTADRAVLERGATVFAENCARCHSSKAPTPAPGLDPAGCAGPGYLQCWDRYWAWTRTDDYRRQMRDIVLAPDFLEGNYLSTDLRVPVTLLQTNACSPLATNALARNIWDNFSSRSYKDLPSVGTVTVHDPFTGDARPFQVPAGGRGYTRPPSLISLWSTAPFLLNNSLGPFDPSPSVEARMRVFQASIEQLLWPERRERDPVLGERVPGLIDRTTRRSTITIPAGYVPEALRPLQGRLHRWFPALFAQGGDITLGPIPAGVPVNLLANLQPLSETDDLSERAAHVGRVVQLLLRLKGDLATLPPNATDEQARRVFADLVRPMLDLSKCPDFVVNRGHYFGTSASGEEPGLNDEDKRALIEFLKTF
jgi:hypothetical protein